MRDDQANGLRRMFNGAAALTVGVVGHGATDLAIDLAAGFAQAHRRVLVLDGRRGELTRAMGLRARYDLLQVLNGDRLLSSALLHAGENVDVLAATRGLAALEACEPDVMRAWRDLGAALRSYDVLLCNGTPADIAGDAKWLLALSPTTSSLTAAYVELKRLARSGRTSNCRVLIDEARTERAALDAFANVSTAAYRFLGVELELCGAVVAETGRALPGSRTPSRPQRSAACQRLVRSFLAEPSRPSLAVNH